MKFQLIFTTLNVIWTYMQCQADYVAETRGVRFTDSFHLYFQQVHQDGTKEYISPWHDIPLYVDSTNQTLNVIVEIPRFTQAKFEINRDELLNPIKQDIKNGNPRFLSNLLPLHGHICNYGAFPQTWEDPYKSDPWTGQKGDKDPLDVCEIGFEPIPTGSVVQVRVLGILGMIDDDETDWKVIVMRKEQADKDGIATMDQLEAVYPGTGLRVREFFRLYKVPQEGRENTFAFDGEIRDADFAYEVIRSTHEKWTHLAKNTTEHDTMSCFSTQIEGTECHVSQDQMISYLQTKPPVSNETAPLPPQIDNWSYVDWNYQEGSGASIPHHHWTMMTLIGVTTSIWKSL